MVKLRVTQQQATVAPSTSSVLATEYLPLVGEVETLPTWAAKDEILEGLAHSYAPTLSVSLLCITGGTKGL